jgi:hypothetical protein
MQPRGSGQTGQERSLQGRSNRFGPVARRSPPNEASSAGPRSYFRAYPCVARRWLSESLQLRVCLFRIIQPLTGRRRSLQRCSVSRAWDQQQRATPGCIDGGIRFCVCRPTSCALIFAIARCRLFLTTAPPSPRWPRMRSRSGVRSLTRCHAHRRRARMRLSDAARASGVHESGRLPGLAARAVMQKDTPPFLLSLRRPPAVSWKALEKREGNQYEPAVETARNG